MEDQHQQPFTVSVQLKNRICQFPATSVEETGDLKFGELIIKNGDDVVCKFKRKGVHGLVEGISRQLDLA